MMSVEDHDAISSTIALLRQYRLLHGFSVMITLSAIVVLLFMALGHELSRYGIGVVVLVIVAGVVEIFLALRVAFDIELLNGLRHTQEEGEGGQALARLDQSLLRLNLIANDKSGRDLDSRLAGCFRLFRRQALCCGIQVFILLLAALLQLLLIG